MYCKKCGKLLDADDRFCSKCGAKVEEEFVPAFKQQNMASGEISEEPPRKPVTPASFNWDLDGYPTDQKKTEAIDFNWDSVLEEKQRNLFARELAQMERQETASEVKAEEESPCQAEPSEETSEAQRPLEETLFAEMNDYEAEEPTRVMDRSAGKADSIDKFYTFNQKNAAFQALLDQEYERIQKGQDFVPSFAVEKETEEPPKAVSESRHEEFDWTLPGDKAFSDAISRETEASEPQLWWEHDQPEVAETADEDNEALKEDAVDSFEEAEPLQADSYIGVVLATTPEGYLELDAPAADTQQEAAVPEASFVAAEEAPVLEDLVQEENAALRQFPPRAGAQNTEAEDKSRLTFYDVFGTDDDDDAPSEEPKKKGKALKIIGIFLCIFIVLDLIALGILNFAPDSKAGELIERGYQSILGLFIEDSSVDEPIVEPASESSEIAQRIEEKKNLGVNIATIEEDQSLLFEDGKDYGFEGFGNAYTFADKPWYTDDEGNSISYGEEIIGTVIQFYSAWVDKINGTNEDILNFVDETSAFYTEIEDLQGEEGVSYGINRLAIGEIRAGGAGFYVYVSVIKVESDSNKEIAEEQIVYMEPVNKTMQIVDIKTI